MPVSGRPSRPLADTKICRNTGIASRAMDPSAESSTGTSRQVIRSTPSSAQMSSTARIASSVAMRACGRKAMPVAYAPGSGSSTPACDSSAR